MVSVSVVVVGWQGVFGVIAPVVMLLLLVVLMRLPCVMAVGVSNANTYDDCSNVGGVVIACVAVIVGTRVVVAVVWV